MGHYENTKAAWYQMEEKAKSKIPYTEKQFDQKIEDAIEDYYSWENKGYVAREDVISSAYSNMAMDIHPLAWFLFIHETPSNMPSYWKYQISLKNLNKMHFLVAKALACGFADNAYNAIEWAKEHK